MQAQELEVWRRQDCGKGVARKLRAKGRIPAVCYRKGIEPIPLSLETRDLEKLLKVVSGQNVLIQLKIRAEQGAEDTQTVILKEVQRDPLSTFLHADFMGVIMDQAITVEVPVRLVGEPSAALREGGLLQQLKRVVEVECLPGDIPEHLDVEVSSLGLGESIHVGEIAVSEGIRVLTDPKEAVVVMSTPVEEEAPEEAEEEGAPAEEGEAAEKEKETEGEG